MTRSIPQYWPRQLVAVLGLTTALAACKSDSTNTAPVVAAAITGDATTNAQSAPVGTAVALPVVVHVTDQNGNPVAGATVAWSVIDGAGVLGASTSLTDVTGSSNMVWTLDTIARVDSVTASIQSGASVVITATGVAGAAATTTKVSGDAQTVTSDSTSQPFVIKVADRYGNPVQGVVVAWTVTGGGALSAASTTTNASGTAQVTLTLGATPGSYSIIATAGLLATVTFTLTGT
jgi:protocatechuate 3,4-dioxygenase beta subunit